jgi:hypothetical protein
MSEQNGTRRMPMRIRRVELEGDYAGWWIDVRINAHVGILEEIDVVKRPAELYELLREIFPGDSNFVDDVGEPIDLHVSANWRRCGPDLIGECLRRFRDEARSPLALTTKSSSSPLSSDTEATSPAATPT